MQYPASPDKSVQSNELCILLSWTGEQCYVDELYHHQVSMDGFASYEPCGSHSNGFHGYGIPADVPLVLWIGHYSLAQLVDQCMNYHVSNSITQITLPFIAAFSGLIPLLL